MIIKTKEPVKQVKSVKAAPSAKAAKPAAQKAAPKQQRVTFSIVAEPGSKVFLAGTFNHWDPCAKEMTDKKGDGVFTATLSLPAGVYQYKFVIDGTWCADPFCADSVANGQGTYNSVKRVF